MRAAPHRQESIRDLPPDNTPAGDSDDDDVSQKDDTNLSSESVDEGLFSITGGIRESWWALYSVEARGRVPMIQTKKEGKREARTTNLWAQLRILLLLCERA